VDWQQKSCTVDAGTRILKWRYVKDSSGYDGDDCGWVDFVQWSGPSPEQDTSNWQEIAYKHDVLGRRVEKKVDGFSTRYVYDGAHVIAEYDGNNNLLRKYMYGPGIDQPVCMIEVADANAVYYYHFDALGSVVALSDAAGDTVQTYEYSVYGEVAVEDANHTNPYMFAGVRFDRETGLYYNRARYYHPFVGRFLQTDPIADGMNVYAYCGNNSLNRVDPSGLYWTFLDSWYVDKYFSGHSGLVFAWVDDMDGNPTEPDPNNVDIIKDFGGLDAWYDWAPGYFSSDEGHAEDWDMTKQIGWELSGTQFEPATRHSREWYFWRLQAVRFLSSDVQATIASIEGLTGEKGQMPLNFRDSSVPNPRMGGTDTNWTEVFAGAVWLNWDSEWTGPAGYEIPNLVTLTHELAHVLDGLTDGTIPSDQRTRENPAISLENQMRLAFYWKVPGYHHLYPLRTAF
jgi:RHS repeat-associated protein